MPTNYVGDPTNTFSPSAKPGPGVYPTIARPVDGDAEDAASIEQPLEVLADFVAYGQKTNRHVSTDFYFEDDFDGSIVDLGKWQDTGGTAPNLTGDAVAGGFGALNMSVVSTTNMQLETCDLGILTSDWILTARQRITSLGGAGSKARVGLRLSNGAQCFFWSEFGFANWYAGHDFGTPGTLAIQDLGVSAAIGAGAPYFKLEIRRVGGQFQWWINGSEALALTPTAVPGAVGPIVIRAERNTSGTTTVKTDFVKLWVPR